MDRKVPFQLERYLSGRREMSLYSGLGLGGGIKIKAILQIFLLVCYASLTLHP